MGKECPYGEKCKFTHDIQSHYQLFPQDISNECSIWVITVSY